MPDKTALFDQTVERFLSVARNMQLEEKYPNQDILRRMTTPDMALSFRLSLARDDGSIQAFTGYQVQFNDDRGPYKGGLRFHPAVNMDEIKTHAFWMYLKTAVTDLPFGGSKGGIAVNYKGLSLSEKERLTKKYFQTVYPFIGPYRDILGPDVNTGPREMAWGIDTLRKLASRWEYGILTGKPLHLGGSIGRSEAPGRGCVFVVKAYFEEHGIDPCEATAVIQGFGNSAQWLAHDLNQMGTKVLAVSDTSCCIHNPKGIDIPAAVEHKKAAGSLKGFAGAEEKPSDDLWEIPCTLLVPAAMEGAVDDTVAHKLSARLIAEVANGAITPEADSYLSSEGCSILPDILANSGGVIVSYYEWLQNVQFETWNRETVEQRLKDRIVSSYNRIHRLSKKTGMPLRLAAYSVAIDKVAAAMAERGVM